MLRLAPSDNLADLELQAYITEFLNHKNPYTKVINGREPAIMAWELGIISHSCEASED